MNKLNIDVQGLTFDGADGKHVYKLDGIELPSVTTIIGYRPDVYSGVSKAVLNNAGDRGTVIHSAIETWIRSRFDTIVSEEHHPYFEAFVKWFETKKVEPLATELPIYHKILRYAGTIDLVAEINGLVTLVDYKTASSILEKPYSLQVEAYRQALKSHGVEIDRKMVLHLKSDGTYTEVEMPDKPDTWFVFNAGKAWYDYWHK